MKVFRLHRLSLFLLVVIYDCGIILPNQNDVKAEETTTATDGSSAADGSCTPTSPGSDTNECVNPDTSTDVVEPDDDGRDSPKHTKLQAVVTKEELSKHNGKDGADIWLSVLGEVYDVTKGEKYYGPGMGYGAFAGTDCSVCFVSGTFTEEEAGKPLEDITDQNIGGILDWKKFYETHETYTHVGRLIDERFFDETGSPTPSMQEFARRVIQYQIEAAEKKKERELKRKKRLEEREAKKKQEEMAKKASQSKAKQPPRRKVPDIL